MNINAATRDQLIQKFHLDFPTADAIVRARDDLGGSFLNWTELREQVGLDETTVELLRQRGVTFGQTDPPEPPLDVPGVTPSVRDPEED
jgi:DNA uptake protein ComE-like DNA-binding protein